MPLSLFFSLLFHVSRIFDKRYFVKWNGFKSIKFEMRTYYMIKGNMDKTMPCENAATISLRVLGLSALYVCVTHIARYAECIGTHSHCSLRRLTITSIVAGAAAAAAPLCLLSISLPIFISSPTLSSVFIFRDFTFHFAAQSEIPSK